MGALVLVAGALAAPAARAAEEVIDLFVVIPPVVAVRVEGEIVFDLSKLRAPRSPADCENVFPPGSACKEVRYDPTGPGEVVVSVFDNSESGATTLHESVDARWEGGNRGRFPQTTDIRSSSVDIDSRTGARGPAQVGERMTLTPREFRRKPAEPRWISSSRSFKLVCSPSDLVATPRGGVQAFVTYSVSHVD
jgi:hypothetical protein